MIIRNCELTNNHNFWLLEIVNKVTEPKESYAELNKLALSCAKLGPEYGAF